MNLISLLVTVLRLALIFSVVWWILGQIPLPEPFGMVARVVVGLIALLVLIGVIFGGFSVPTFRLQ